MKRIWATRLVSAFLPVFLSSSTAGALEHRYCGRAEAWLAPSDSSAHRKYAPDREFDILHIALDVTPDFRQRTVRGETTVRFKPVARPLAELTLDGVDLAVESVTGSEKVGAFQATERNVIVTFAQPVAVDKETTVTIKYSATPRKGLYFRTPEMGYKPEDMHLWTQGEPIEARHWYPSFDAPNEKFTSEVTCRVPEGMVVLSNGQLMSEEKQAGSDLVAVRWSQDKPHVNYLICLVAGRLKKIEDKYKDIPLAFYTPASQIAYASNSFKGTKAMMEFFEKEIGVPYPWAKYYQVCVDDFGWGGMENTSLTTLHDRTLHPAEFEPLRSSTGLVAHELAHQWFGDLLTCKDWAHVWLNEGFASYYDILYEGQSEGREAMLYSLYQSAKTITGHPDQTNAVVRRDFNHPEQQFGYQVYPKGAWVLHMLRSQLGEELYRKCIKTYVERHQYDTVVTEDLNAVIEEVSGRSFDQFFDQYVYHASQPDLNATHSWDEKTKLAKITVEQKQKLSEDVLLFNVPLTVRFKTKGTNTDRRFTVKEKAEDFYFSLSEGPEIVRIDPDLTVLARITFNLPNNMLYAQLADKSDLVGRLLAAEQLGTKKDRGAVAKLKETLNSDSFYGVRIAASRALRAIDSEEAYEALLASTSQEDPRARRQVLADIAGSYRERSCKLALDIVEKEKHPDIRAGALTALGAYHKPEVEETLVRQLRSESYKNVVAEGAINGIRAQGDGRYVKPLADVLREADGKFTTSGYVRGLETLAYIARHEENKDTVREFLVNHVDHPKERIQVAAINALGTLDDAKAIPVLEKFTTALRESPERTAAEKALTLLRDNRPPPVELGSLRGEVLTLQRENRELRKELDDLKKRFEALAKTNAPAAKPSSKSKVKRP
ncbi:MAG: HEAT repeat domain-containing protein [Verrucomicrobia subdivision 3 bacterium]|nr:HEAT repeat domain-containing protein [Limisphaerales bacterium]